MRKFQRPIVIAVAGVVLTSAWAANATTDTTRVVKPICNQVKDTNGDAKGTGLPVSTPQSDANLDIVSADVATNATTITGVIRLAGLAANDNLAPSGREYRVTFQVGETVAEITAVISPSGTSWNGGTGRGVVDTNKKQIRISVPLTKLPVRVRPGTPLKNVGALTFRVGLTSNVALGLVDAARTSRTYVAGTATCVKVGA